ncbi:hypothetical protein [Aureisphaera sp.]
MKIPNVAVDEHKRIFGLTILNTRRSAFAGIVLLMLPLIFLLGVLAKHYLAISIPVISSVYDWIGEMDRQYGDSSILNWVIRILLLFGPLVGLAINLLAVSHVRLERNPYELVISLKFKWINWILILVCTLVLLIFFFYLIMENA